MPRYLTLLDTRGLMLKSYHGSRDNDGREKSDGTRISSWEGGLRKFIEDVVEPVLSDRQPPQDVIACWDGGNTYRRKLFPEYKAARREKVESDPKVVEEIAKLEKATKRLLNYLGIRTVFTPGEEADDLVALLAARLEFDHCTIRTNDGDLTQLVSDRVSVWFGDRFCSLSDGDFKGTPYHLVRLHKALLGDSSDGYGGVKGFGPKALERLADTFGADGLEQIQTALQANDWTSIQYAQNETQNADLLKLLAHWLDAKKCMTLATLHPDACYGNLNGKKPKRPVWSARVPNRDKVAEILNELGYGRRISQFEHLFPTQRLVTTADAAEMPTIAQEILSSPIVSYDYESTDALKHPEFQQASKGFVDVLSQKLAGISVNYGRFMEKTIYMPVDHKDTANYPTEWVTWLLQAIDARADRAVVQNASFELAVSQTNLNYMPRAPYDTRIMSSYVDENAEAGLKMMSLSHLGYHQTSYAEVTQGRDMRELTGDEVLSYGCDDSLVTSHLFSLFRDILQCEGSWDFYRRNEVDPEVNDALDFVDGMDIDYTELAAQTERSSEQIQSHSRAIRGLLREHCGPSRAETDQGRQEAQQAALTLYNEWLALPLYKVNGDPEREKKLREETWDKAWKGCFYQDRVEEVIIDTFSPTVTQINRILGIIDPKAPKVIKLSGPGIEQFDGAMTEYRASFGSASHTTPTLDKLDEFVSLMFAARKKFGPTGRHGEEYRAFVEFCQDILAKSRVGKVRVSGDELNMGSGPQMQALLYGKLALPIRKRSPVVKGSARDAHSLEGSAATGLKAIASAFVYDMPEGNFWKKDLLESYKIVATEQQNQSLFYGPYPLWKHPRDGKIHPGIRNCGTATRRPTSSSPNILQVSKKDNARLRKVYLAGDYGDGPRVVVSADFSNQELVITAAESKDPVMLAAFMSNPRRDLHSVSATAFAHILLPRMGVKWTGGQLDYDTFAAGRRGELGEEMIKPFNEIRNKYAKPVGFLICYGGGPTTLASNLMIPKELAEDLMSSVFDLYPRLKPWQNETIMFAREHGYTQTAYGNRRHAEQELWSSDKYTSKRQERQLVNAVIQSTAADILKVVRQEIVTRDMRNRYSMRAVRPVYDEITASVPLACAVDYMAELSEVMSVTPPGYPVGMQVELSVGRSWGDQVELGVFDRALAEKTVGELK